MARTTGVTNGQVAAFALMAVLAGCGSDAVAEKVPGSGPAIESRAAPPARGPGRKPCGASEIERSTCMIELILADLASSGIGVGVGGITSIKAGAGLSYTVALPKEERTVLLTYEFTAGDGGIAIGGRKEAIESY